MPTNSFDIIPKDIPPGYINIRHALAKTQSKISELMERLEDLYSKNKNNNIPEIRYLSVIFNMLDSTWCCCQSFRDNLTKGESKEES